MKMFLRRRHIAHETRDIENDVVIQLPNEPEPTIEELLQAAESGDVEDFMRLYLSEPTRLTLQDGRGRTAIHQAAARNNVNILAIIKNYTGSSEQGKCTSFVYSHIFKIKNKYDDLRSILAQFITRRPEYKDEGRFRQIYLNAKDHAGNTPLHLAIENEALEAIEFLLQQRIDANVLNDEQQAPIHLATELNKVSVLEIFTKYKNLFEIDIGGEHGRTALHVAAIHDHDECAQILLSGLNVGAKIRCNNGYYPIHEAAKNASSKTMEVLLQWAESNGCSREEMLSLYDNEGNVPLHSAVHGGDIRAVELCLKSGAKISTQQHDLSTPVHLACSQGALEIVKLMFTMQPTEKMPCLNSCDVQKMTPIHCAAIFDHPDVVEYLVSEGSDLNPLDKERRSPLLLAASRGGWRTVHILIRLGADLGLKDINMRNVLHLVVLNGGQLEEFANNCISQSEESLAKLLNEKDKAGCSPLHYASREGHIKSLESLLKLGAIINPKNQNNESPLHFAARYGRYHTVSQLLDSKKGPFIINESDGDGLTPLHIAAREGHVRVVQLLLNRGALLHRDHNGRNPLHLAAMNGHTQTVELLHSVHSHLLDRIDKDGNTPLHLATMENKPNSISLLLSMGCELAYNLSDMSAIDYAIYYKFPEAALAMVTHEKRAQEVMALRSNRHPCVTLALIAYMPRVFEAVQDRCITKANCKKDSKSFFIKYSFKYYQHSRLEIEALRQACNDPKFQPEPLCVINAMVAHGRVELLAHPLSQKYLQMKWNSYGKYFHLANLLFYCIFLVFVTIYGYLLMRSGMEFNHQNIVLNATQSRDRVLNIDNSHDINEIKIFPFSITFKTLVASYVSRLTILSYNGICLVRELYNIKQQKWHYLADPANFVSWILYVSSTLMVWPTNVSQSEDLQYSAGAITMFLAWFELLLLLQRFDQIGIYVVMFLEILQTLIKVLMVFSILIIAFGLSFFVLLSKGNHLSFGSIPMSLLRTFAMMLGEIDFVGTYVHPYYTNQKNESNLFKSESEVFLPYPLMTFLILGLFMVLMPILLMNLLIGLAVGDIESVRRNAQLKRLAMQVVLHTELERKLPAFILAKVDKTEVVEYPNNCSSKLGFLDTVLRKWFCNPFTEDAGLDLVLETNEDYLAEQLQKNKERLRDIRRILDQQQTLLKLVVQKMEIKTEADDVDEGVEPSELRLIPRSPPRVRPSQRPPTALTRAG